MFEKEGELPYIWEIGSNGCTSYLVGTIHFYNESFKKQFKKLLNKVDTVLLEFDPVVAEEWLKINAEKLMDDMPICLENRLDKEPIKQIKSVLSFKTPWFVINHMTPSFAYATINASSFMKFGYKQCMDEDLYKLAKKQNKQIIGLETVEDQIKMISAVGDSMYIAALENTNSKILKSDIEKITEIYKKGNLEDVVSFRSRSAPELDEAILAENIPRDIRLYNTLKPLLNGKNLIVVGVFHTKYFTEQLTADGYAVKRIDNIDVCC